MNYKNLLFFNKKGHQQSFKWNGSFWEGRILFPEVSEDLFEIEHLFLVEKMLDGDEVKYGIPHGDEPNVFSNSLGVKGAFTSGSNIVTLTTAISSELIGSTIFSDGLEDSGSFSGKIIDISGNSIKLDTNATVTGNFGISLVALRSRFESTYNILDFDESKPFTASWITGTNTIKFVGEIDAKPGQIIVGEGIQDETRIISIKGNIITLNKNFTTSETDIICYTYYVEDRNDVKDRMYQYSLIEDTNLDAPVLSNVLERFYPLDYQSDDSTSSPSGLRNTSLITSESLAINLALNSDQEGFIGRSFILEDISSGVPRRILRVELIGEVVGEDERLNVLLQNFGQGFFKEDAGILRDSDPNEPYPDYELINSKRKELLLQGADIFPFIGSYKGLVNIIKFFGYQDLRIKEYWLNLQKSSTDQIGALQYTEDFLNKVKSTPYGEAVLIDNLLDDENSGKFKQVEVYGKRKDGTYGIKSSLEQIFPSTAYKKTPLFGLFYDINEVVEGEEDEWGYPVTQNAFLFTPEEVLIKLFALKEKLKKDYLPLSAKIIDITGEGIYFGINKTRGWVDTLKVNEIRQGVDIEMAAYPNAGYIEDLRAFQTRINTDNILLPFVTGYEGNDQFSNFGNVIDVNPFNQEYTPVQAETLCQAIEKYYINLNSLNGRMDLGDGDYDGIGYVKKSDNTPYYLPGGFPTILEVTSFHLSMNEIQSSWSNLDRNIATYVSNLASWSDLSGYIGDNLITGSLSQEINLNIEFGTIFTLNLPLGFDDILIPSSGKVQLEIRYDSLNHILVEVQNYDISTGETEVLVLSKSGTGIYDTWVVNLTNIFPDNLSIEYYNYTYGNDGFYTWDNIRFVGFYEIEWTISKDGESPYFFQYRGKITDYNRLPHILPYLGEYSIKCRVWDSFNDVSIAYFDKYIKVEPRNVEFTSVARFREAEVYTWDQMVKTWNDYDSQWVFPIEQQKSQKQPSQRLLTYAEYGNKLNEGQECKVLQTIPEVRSSLEFNIGIISRPIVSIGGNSGPAIITTSTDHGLATGQRVYIVDNGSPSISGEYIATYLTQYTFSIPMIVPVAITTPNNYMTGPGRIRISINDREYANVRYSGSIAALAGNIYSAMNNSSKTPHFTVKEYFETSVVGMPSNVFLYRIKMEGPEGSGSLFNGQQINITAEGHMGVNDLVTPSLFGGLTPVLQGGVNQYQDYLPYSPGDDLPVEAMKNWGSKGITWDSLDDVSWDDMYAHTWTMLDYHQDWLGGFDLYNIRHGDRIKVGKNNPGILIEDTLSPGLPNNINLYDVAQQLNDSTDPGLSKFYYTVRGYSRLDPSIYSVDGQTQWSSPAVPTMVGPINEVSNIYDLGFNPNAICQGFNGETYLGLNDKIVIYQSPTTTETISLDYAGKSLQIDRKGRLWYYGSGSVPLQIIDPQTIDRKIAVIKNNSQDTSYYQNIRMPFDYTAGEILSLAIDDRDNDFAIVTYCDSVQRFLYYDGGRQEFDVFLSSDIEDSLDIRQMVFDYQDGVKKLWMISNKGIIIYDGIKFTTLNTGNSGLCNNNVYSICIDEIGNKWLGLPGAISYYDGETWAVWTNDNSPELPANAKFTNIVNTGHANIFFTASYNSGGYGLCYFNGDNFNIYNNLPGTSDPYLPYIDIVDRIENTWIISSNVKRIDGDYYEYPGNIFLLDSSQNLVHIDYNIPHVHACSKYPGSEGWDFIYHESLRSLPTVYDTDLGYVTGIMGFNFITGDLNGNYILNSQFRPKMPFVDSYSWKMPHWTGYDFTGIIKNYPDLNPDHLFLDAPLKDLLNGKALKEEYWKNPPIERFVSKKDRELISDFEWLVRVGGIYEDSGVKITIDKEGYIYVTGYFQGSMYFGSPNSINSSAATTLNSPNSRAIFVAKYNSAGIIQWARSYGDELDSSPSSYDYDFTPKSIKVDTFGNIYVVGFNVKARNNNTGVLPTNILVKWDWNGDFLSYSQLFTPGVNTILDENFDVAIDEVNNLYITGEFEGTLTYGDTVLDSAGYVATYVAKIEYDGFVTYLKQPFTKQPERNPSVMLGSYNDLYLCYTSSDNSSEYVYVSSYNSLDFTLNWRRAIKVATNNPGVSKASVYLSKRGEIAVAFPFNGVASSGPYSIMSNGTKDIGLFKFLITGSPLWGKNVGSTLGTFVHDLKMDDNDRMYLLSSYGGAFFHVSPEPLEESVGELDILLIKLESDGEIIDIVSSGSLATDEALSISLDQEQNIYMTGYISGAVDWGHLVSSPSSGGSKDVFIGKIPYEKFIPGKSMGGVISWMGTQTWGWSDKRIYGEEFEIPLATTVFMNPMDSNIPGKKGHKWKLTNTLTGEVIIDLKDTPYFIWTFKEEGYYSIELQLLDTNGNVYKVDKPGYVRVINHKKPFDGEVVPHLINSNDFKRLAVYEN